MRSSRPVGQTARYEIFAEGDGWKCRFFDGVGVVGLVARPLPREQCLKAVQIFRNTLSAPVHVIR